jgi:hypothetical protein
MIAIILGFTAFVFLAMEAVKVVMRRRISRP